jgi:hypothetical protein
VLSVQGIASMTPVQVSQATASNLNATVVGTGTFAVQANLTAGTAIAEVGTAVPNDAVLIGFEDSEGEIAAVELDAAGNVPVAVGAALPML